MAEGGMQYAVDNKEEQPNPLAEPAVSTTSFDDKKHFELVKSFASILKAQHDGIQNSLHALNATFQRAAEQLSMLESWSAEVNNALGMIEQYEAYMQSPLPTSPYLSTPIANRQLTDGTPRKDTKKPAPIARLKSNPQASKFLKDFRELETYPSIRKQSSATYKNIRSVSVGQQTCATSTSTHDAPHRPVVCLVCTGDHGLYRCPVFHEMTLLPKKQGGTPARCLPQLPQETSLGCTMRLKVHL